MNHDLNPTLSAHHMSVDCNENDLASDKLNDELTASLAEGICD